MFRFSPRPNRALEIAWKPWSEETFAEAAAADKPVLLSLSAVWCHWCHVMDETTYSDETVIKLLNERFVAVRVDSDKRPDINARYNMGGWPSTAVLTPQGEILSGSTYVPAVAMAALLERVYGFYTTRRAHIADHLAQMRSMRDARVAADTATPGELDPAIAGEIMSNIIENYDEEHGGFGTAPKFPQNNVLAYLLATWRVARMEEQRADRREIRSGVVTTKSVFTDAASKYEAILRHTLSGMIYGGLYDTQEGGFYRYSTEADWSVPHYEKLTEEHAGLMPVIAGVYRITGDDDLRGVLQQTCQWIRTTLYDAETHVFGGSQDAEEAYSQLDLQERRKLEMPYVDRTSYTQATAALAGALCDVADVLADRAIAESAEAVLDNLHEQARDESGLLCHVLPRSAGETGSERFLVDQTSYLRALLDAHEYGGAARFLERARAIADVIVPLFSSENRLRDHVAGHGIGALVEAEFPLNENASAAESLIRLAALTGNEVYRTQAGSVLRAYAAAARTQALFGASYATALSRMLSPVSILRIAADSETAQAFRHAARQLPDPYLVVHTDAHDADQNVAYLCRGTTCAAPTLKASELRASWEWILAAS